MHTVTKSSIKARNTNLIINLLALCRRVLIILEEYDFHSASLIMNV